jgi:hypothetical protein
MFTGKDAAPATEANIMIQANNVAAAIVAVFDRANTDAFMAVGTLCRIYFYYFWQIG